MSDTRRSINVSQFLSPHGLALLSFAFFLFCWIFPPHIYSNYMDEPDLLFLDPATFLFFVLCLAAFLAGHFAASYTLGETNPIPRAPRRGVPQLLFLLFPVALTGALTAWSTKSLISENPGILLALFAQEGSQVKEMVAAGIPGHFSFGPTLLIASTWWAYWQSHALQLRSAERRILLVLLGIAYLLVTFCSLLILSRTLIMLSFFGSIVLILMKKAGNRRLSMGKTAIYCLVVIAGLVILFAGMSFLRGVANWDEQVRTLIGYSAASYNRLAAMVNGRLRYPFQGRGIYLSPFVAFNSTLNSVLPLASYMHWPARMDVWTSEFSAMSTAGLQANLIWSGTFGYLFSELGWFAFLFTFLYGVLYGIVWKWFRSGKTIGVILYPCFAFCILFWVGSNYLLDSDPMVLLVGAFLLSIYQNLLSAPQPVTRPLASPQRV